MNTLISLIARLMRPLANGLYFLFKLAPVREKVTFLSRQSDGPSEDFLLLKDELSRQNHAIKFSVSCKKVKPGFVGGISYLATTLSQMHSVATSRVVVLDGYLPVVSYLKQRESLYVVQLWHALGAMKKFSYQTLDRPGGRPSVIAYALRMHQNYSVLACGSNAMKPFYSEAFRMPETRISVLPLPRVDILKNPDSNRLEAIVDAHAELQDGRPIVLYAPTFRDTGTYANHIAALENLARSCASADFKLILKLHPRMTAAVNGSEVLNAAHVLGSEVDTFDLISIATHVVTDYSAVAFEAAVAKKSLWFYVYDIEEYCATRGLNVDPRIDMPHRTFLSSDELVDAMKSRSLPDQEQEHFSEKYVAPSRYSATATLARFILKGAEL